MRSWSGCWHDDQVHVLDWVPCIPLVGRDLAVHSVVLGSVVHVDRSGVMKYHIYQETTEWSMDVPNHIYIFKDKIVGRSAKAIGYVREGCTEVQKFKKPMVLDLKGRTFEVLDR